MIDTEASAPTTSDEELIRSVRAGDARAYGELWQRYAKAGFRAASSYRRLIEPGDLVSEAYAVVLRAIRSAVIDIRPTGCPTSSGTRRSRQRQSAACC